MQDFIGKLHSIQDNASTNFDPSKDLFSILYIKQSNKYQFLCNLQKLIVSGLFKYNIIFQDTDQLLLAPGNNLQRKDQGGKIKKETMKSTSMEVS